ncbi:amidohydrolase [Acidaminobacterium chupaoyuni]
MSGKIAFDEIDAQRRALEQLSRKLWENPEGGYQEKNASRWIAEFLEEQGFQVERGVGGIPTALRASWGSGKPRIGFLGEYDALPGMSQTVTTRKSPIKGQRYGHGCGHNLLAAAHLGAVIGLKKEMEKKQIGGTIVYFGCPAEELLTGKGYMAREHVFDGLDCAAAFHPGVRNVVTLGNSLALDSVKFHFHGITAHAGGDTYNGRSALDAAEITNVGANYLREHTTDDVRIHYVITDGGVAPNIVPDYAAVWYYVRAQKRETVDQVYQRLVQVAQGAAEMTETELEIEYLGGCYETMNNAVLAETVDACMREIPREAWSPQEIEFAGALNAAAEKQTQAVRAAYGLCAEMQLHDQVAPISTESDFGSTDVGDVCQITPTISFNTACWGLGAPGHSWQVTACSGSSIGQKGMIYAAKVMAYFGLKVLEEPEILQRAKSEFERCKQGKSYVCPIPMELGVPPEA